MALSGKVLSEIVLVVLIVHGFPSGLLEKVRIIDEQSGQHAHDKDVENGKQHLLLEGADNQTSTPSSSIKCPQCPFQLTDEPSRHDDPVAEPNSLIIPTSSASLPSSSLRASDQISQSGLPKPSTVPGQPTLLQPGMEEPLPMGENASHVNLNSNLETEDFDNFIGGDPMLDPSFSPSSFLRSLCPNQTCQNLEYGTNPTDPCCLACDCTDGCNATGTCCADYSVNGSLLNNHQNTSSTREVCIDPAMHGQFYKTYTQSYMMVSACSPLFMEDKSTLSYSTKCEQPDELTTMDSLTPVYHAETGLTYRNIFCATCNFATDHITRWIPMLSCRQMFESLLLFDTFNNSSDVLQQVKRQGLCNVIWYPLNVLNKPCFNRQDLVSSCTVHVNPIVQAFCEEDEFTAPFKYDGIVYKNVFCLRCTTDVQIHPNMCVKEDPMKVHKFKAILDVDRLDAVQTVVNPQNVAQDGCRDGFEMDMDLKACRQMTCSVSKFNVNGVCQPVYDKVDGLGLQFSLILEYLENIPPYNEVMLDARQFLPDDLALCHDSMTHDGEVTVTYVSIMVPTVMISIQATFDEFEKKVNTYQEGIFRVKIGGHRHYPFPFRIKNYVTYDIDSSTRDPQCPSSIAMSKIQFCDTVLVDIIPKVFNDGTVVINGLEFKPYDVLIRRGNNLPDQVQICQESLLRVLSLMFGMSESDLSTPGPNTSSVSCVPICLFNVAAMCLIAVLINNK